MTEKDILNEETQSEETRSEEMRSEETNSEETRSEETISEETRSEECGESAEEELDPVEKLQAELAEVKNQLLYKAAEFENYRKRTLKERAELILNGGEKVITAILPVLDDMERAIANGSKTEDPQVLREGMELIYQKFVKTLESQGVSKIETKDADFDTDLHEAVAMVPGMGDDKKGKVIDCLQEGYKLNDKVIRHAKVAVGQ